MARTVRILAVLVREGSFARRPLECRGLGYRDGSDRDFGQGGPAGGEGCGLCGDPRAEVFGGGDVGFVHRLDATVLRGLGARTDPEAEPVEVVLAGLEG